MNNADAPNGDRHIDEEFDAVQMAVIGTDNYDVSMWWYEAIRIVGHELHPELEDEIQNVAEYLSNAIYNYHNQ